MLYKILFIINDTKITFEIEIFSEKKNILPYISNTVIGVISWYYNTSFLIYGQDLSRVHNKK